MKYMQEERNLENSINLSIAERNSSFLPFILEGTSNRRISPAFHRNCGCSPVLIVDDQPINTLILSEFCSRINIKSDTVDNGEKAIHKCLEQQHKV
jgi:hypothetical protein